jgi:hypothetical protein
MQGTGEEGWIAPDLLARTAREKGTRQSPNGSDGGMKRAPMADGHARKEVTGG